jgi:hypothetical protein
MAGQLLKTYLERNGIKQIELARNIDRTKANVYNWLKAEATIELTELGIRIRTPNGFIVHETKGDV